MVGSDNRNTATIETNRAKTLMSLRWVAAIGQTITCLVVDYFFGFQLPWIEILLTILA